MSERFVSLLIRTMNEWNIFSNISFFETYFFSYFCYVGNVCSFYVVVIVIFWLWLCGGISWWSWIGWRAFESFLVFDKKVVEHEVLYFQVSEKVSEKMSCWGSNPTIKWNLHMHYYLFIFFCQTNQSK
jgi:hypothetical protein